MGGGKSQGSSNTQVQLDPAQRKVLDLQAGALEKTFLPAYQNTVNSAKDIYDKTAGGVTSAAANASKVAGQTGALQGALGASSLASGVQGLQSLFDPNYENQQVNAAFCMAIVSLCSGVI